MGYGIHRCLSGIVALMLSGTVLCALLALAGCNKKAAPAMGAGGRPPTPVTVAYAISKDVPVYIKEIGKCAAVEVVTIEPQVGGQVTDKYFEDGTDLKKGQPLYTIDIRPFKAAVDQANATLLKDQAAAEGAQAFAKRQQQVFQQRSISENDYDQARFAAKSALALVEGDKAAVSAAELNLQYCSITSPIDGRAGQHQVDVGNIVKANEGSMLVIQRMDPIYVDFTIPEKSLSQVRSHMAAGTLKTIATIPDQSGEGREGDLTFLDNSVQDGSGTVKLRATIPNTDRRFWPGQFVDVTLVLKVNKGAVLIPTAATQISQQGPFVFVVRKDSTAELRPVKPGQRQGEMVVVEDGLSAGDAVVTEGQMLIFPNGPVKVVKEEGTKPEAAETDEAHAAATSAKGGHS